jgi:hypothetical protein
LPSYGAKTRGGRGATGFVHGRFCGFFVECERLTTTDALLSSLPKKSTENGIVTVYEAFYASEFPTLIQPLFNPYSTLRELLAN